MADEIIDDNEPFDAREERSEGELAEYDIGFEAGLAGEESVANSRHKKNDITV
jgi:hypothetical protein